MYHESWFPRVVTLYILTSLRKNLEKDKGGVKNLKDLLPSSTFQKTRAET